MTRKLTIEIKQEEIELIEACLFFVLHGLLNGEEGIGAMRAGSGKDPRDLLADGFYYGFYDLGLEEVGPFKSFEACKKAALSHFSNIKIKNSWNESIG